MNRSWRQHPIKQQLYAHLPSITKTMPVRRTRHAGHCWRSRDELISHGWAKAGWPARTYIQQLCEDTGCSPGDLPEAMNDREGWRDKMMMMIVFFTQSKFLRISKRLIGLMGRVFANGPGDLGSTLSNTRYVSKVKWSNPRKGVAPSPTLQCSSYWKGSLLVALDNGHQLYFTSVCK